MASALSVAAHLGLFGPLAQAFSAEIAMATALVTAPLLAWVTRGRYYIARSGAGPAAQGAHVQKCVICEREYEGPDMAHCPAYQGQICSLCCTLDARCGDLCKPHASMAVQWSAALRWVLPRAIWRYLDTGLGHFLLLMLVIAPLLAAVMAKANWRIFFHGGSWVKRHRAAQQWVRLWPGKSRFPTIFILVACSFW